MNKNSMRDVFMYYANMNGRTQDEIASMFGISRVRVAQCIKRVRLVDSGKMNHGPTKEALKIFNS